MLTGITFFDINDFKWTLFLRGRTFKSGRDFKRRDVNRTGGKESHPLLKLR